VLSSSLQGHAPGVERGRRKRRKPQIELAEVARRGRGGERRSFASTCDLDASGVQGKALKRSRLVRVGVRSQRLTENTAVTHRKHPCTLVPALRSNTAFGIADGLNRREHGATF
jgi:hypothetical protein